MESLVIKNPSATQRRWLEISRITRATEWWEFKLSPILATAYATAFLLRLSIISLWPQLLLTLVALAACASYVSVINDLTDLEDDFASGKVNRLAGKSRAFIVAALTCPILLGTAIAIYWRSDQLLLSLYLASWIAFTLYSLPLIRLKNRGVFGLVADASGAHLFPTLLAVTIVYRSHLESLDLIWFALVGVWSLSFGLRGILWHQLSDLHNDEKIGLQTFARRHKITWLRSLGNFVIFPIELCAFALILWRVNSRVALAFLCYYALLTFLRKRFWDVNPVVVVPKDRYHIVMQEYYELFFPLALLLSSSGRYPLDAFVILPHLLLFPRRAVQSLKDMKVFIGAFKLINRRIRDLAV
ncbi:MAG TPA: UbiA family prenyltransferase [Pyrinomonadaceae bacterium]|nr:UbiA family prenyltransferase [Pyrinomonadaceae bacterium]